MRHMPLFQRYLIVAMAASYWALSVLLSLVLYSWVSGAKEPFPWILLNALFAGCVGAFFGLLCALISYVRPLNGSWPQRVLLGLLLGLCIAAIANAIKPVLPAGWSLLAYATVSSSLPVALLIFAGFGLATPRKIFFAIAK
jgi:hypothetical protein